MMQRIVPDLHAQFREKTVQKRYLAVIAGMPRWHVDDSDGWITVNAPIGRDINEECVLGHEC